jgi:hypothetical protein
MPSSADSALCRGLYPRREHEITGRFIYDGGKCYIEAIGVTMTREERRQYAQKQLTIYAPNIESIQAWKAAAEGAGLPLSKFVVECIEQAIAGETKPPVVDVELTNRLMEENADLRQKLERTARDAQHEYHLRMLEISDLEELKLTTRNVLITLREGGLWTPQKIADEFNREVPGVADIRLISKALANLADLELITEESKGWRYSG